MSSCCSVVKTRWAYRFCSHIGVLISARRFVNLLLHKLLFYQVFGVGPFVFQREIRHERKSLMTVCCAAVIALIGRVKNARKAVLVSAVETSTTTCEVGVIACVDSIESVLLFGSFCEVCGELEFFTLSRGNFAIIH